VRPGIPVTPDRAVGSHVGKRTTSGAEPASAERADSECVRRCVHSAVERLPADERSVIELAYWGELSRAEIAERLGLPLGVAQTRARNGLTRLASLLEDATR
jgi:RNA polymerase sigma factor (sigma-70 family)